jgi:hypothetical protein
MARSCLDPSPEMNRDAGASMLELCRKRSLRGSRRMELKFPPSFGLDMTVGTSPDFDRQLDAITILALLSRTFLTGIPWGGYDIVLEVAEELADYPPFVA